MTTKLNVKKKRAGGSDFRLRFRAGCRCTHGMIGIFKEMFWVETVKAFFFASNSVWFFWSTQTNAMLCVKETRTAGAGFPLAFFLQEPQNLEVSDSVSLVFLLPCCCLTLSFRDTWRILEGCFSHCILIIILRSFDLLCNFWKLRRSWSGPPPPRYQDHYHYYYYHHHHRYHYHQQQHPIISPSFQLVSIRSLLWSLSCSSTLTFALGSELPLHHLTSFFSISWARGCMLAHCISIRSLFRSCSMHSCFILFKRAVCDENACCKEDNWFCSETRYWERPWRIEEANEEEEEVAEAESGRSRLTSCCCSEVISSEERKERKRRQEKRKEKKRKQLALKAMMNGSWMSTRFGYNKKERWRDQRKEKKSRLKRREEAEGRKKIRVRSIEKQTKPMKTEKASWSKKRKILKIVKGQKRRKSGENKGKETGKRKRRRKIKRVMNSKMKEEGEQSAWEEKGINQEVM